MKSANSLTRWEADPGLNEGVSLRPMPGHTDPLGEQLRYHFATAVDNTSSKWTHGDWEIVSRASQRLRASGHRVLRAIQCECEQGILRLRGNVTSFFHLQLAQELVRSIDGVNEFLIDLNVVEADRPPAELSD
jgi:hypothetical protein